MSIAERLANLWIGRKHADPGAVAQALAQVAQLKPAVVVTGGSRGLGLAVAERFLSAGSTIVLVARTGDELERAAAAMRPADGRLVSTIVLDVTEPASGPKMQDALSARGLYCDVLVNSAGLGAAGPFDEASPGRLRQVLDLNITALTELTRHMLPGMLARRRGGILNIASLGGAVPGPGQSAYYASKAYVLSLTEALAAECAGQGVRISVLAPGPLDTGFHADMGAEGALYRTLLPTISLRRAAGAAYRGYAMGQTVIVPGLLNRLMYGAVRLLPHPVSVPILKVLLRAPVK